ncbi:MAG: sulfatase, partial [Planctomycetota bacterium]
MRKTIDILKVTLATLCVALPSLAQQVNVLFIAVDDLNHWVGHLNGHPGTRTPNIDRLAARGVSFTRAYCSAPLCNPSRVSLMTGLNPHRTGVYGNGEKMRDRVPDAVTLTQYFMKHGYTAKGGGKIFHGSRIYDEASWDEYFSAPNAKRPRAPRPPNAPRDMWKNWGPTDLPDEAMFDTQIADRVIAELTKPQSKPFLLAYGLTKPHMPWVVPQKYFDMHPLDSIVLPRVIPNDLADVPPFARKLAAEVYDPSGAKNFAHPGGDHNSILKHNQWKQAVQGYLATISYADAQVGRVLDALDNSPHAGNTIVVLWGDHGWHLGQKEHWRKHALWEDSIRTTLVIAPPGFRSNTAPPGSKCERVVSLIDLYPTLVEMAGLPPRDGLDGQSLVPLLQNPTRDWPRPALTTYGYNNHSLRTERYRYTLYHDGTE